MEKVQVCLWFDTEAEEAARFYTSLVADGEIGEITRYQAGVDHPTGDVAGQVLTVDFSLNGQRFMALNGGPMFPQTEAASIVLSVRGQDEVDRLWDALTADGGQESQCGWCKDRWGVSWQIVPEEWQEIAADPARSRQAMERLYGMKKIIIADLL